MTRFGVVTYGTAPQQTIDLVDSDDNQQAHNNIDLLQLTTGSPTDDAKLIPALDFAVERILTDDGVRTGVAKSVVVIGHEPSSETPADVDQKISEVSSQVSLKTRLTLSLRYH